ncbi:(NiFe) hydrogenase maturation protein HypF [Gloeothece citriformis PCC 7424]|uniref:Carbamoyltransferase n=1 Tax=Gloeothece citriformis (strain PCC 7424) TaxID=65393 RepID=B7KHW8_GLOC7|nr:carbamoyltransferase HypF [Gloeothece citriformis]ACK72065.1 (NiFe) hydrogenase maturation protein HypF [Gloeothece citriformis PCC 7424]
MADNTTKQRLSLIIRGAVQGVGFRPFIYRLATELDLVGWVNNSSVGVFIEVEGDKDQLDTFLRRVQTENPPRSQIQAIETQWLDLTGYKTFEIRHSVSGEKTAVVLPDLATCPDCLQDIFDPHNRRYRYPFTNCTNCGPRYTIIEALPYDRCHTTMKGFKLCPQCQAEYENPLDRRFHAQPNACPKCGPHLELWDQQGQILETHESALMATATAIREGKIVAIKGLGGFHLVVDARNTTAVQELRKRKQRPDKPFAVMYPSLNLLKEHCLVTPTEEALLNSAECPIVLLKVLSSNFRSPLTPLYKGGNIRKEGEISPAVAPNNPYLGVMLPYTPLHHLLLAELGFPIVATSGNISDEPICIDELEALQKLNQIADLFLIHNRPIFRPVDDSIVRMMGGREMVMRRARGYAPFPIMIKSSPTHSQPSILAVGGHLKNTIAIARPPQIFLSQHIGDLETPAAFEYFQQVIASLRGLYDFNPQLIARDAHPDYISSQFAQEQNLPLIKVQHHYAHVLSCMAEHGLEPPVLGVAWDGTGYGEDETIWGGEFIYVTEDHYQRVAHFRPWRLPGGEKAVKEPRRSALGLLEAINLPKTSIEKAFTPQELVLLQTILKKHLNSPLTSSVGRLFDGVASLLNIRHQASFEGQAAMELEFIIGETITDKYYDFLLSSSTPTVIDWSPIIKAILNDIFCNISLGQISVKFHNTLVKIILEIVKRFPAHQIVLTGGCFQNRYLTERAIEQLQQHHYRPYWHQSIPPNDGGIALGQVIATLSKRMYINDQEV